MDHLWSDFIIRPPLERSSPDAFGPQMTLFWNAFAFCIYNNTLDPRWMNAWWWLVAALPNREKKMPIYGTGEKLLFGARSVGLFMKVEINLRIRKYLNLLFFSPSLDPRGSFNSLEQSVEVELEISIENSFFSCCCCDIIFLLLQWTKLSSSPRRNTHTTMFPPVLLCWKKLEKLQ